VELRTAQYRESFDEAFCLRFDRALALDRLSAARKTSGRAASLGELLGFEGDAAAVYFRAFDRLLAPPKAGPDAMSFRFDARNRRPPLDPVNAMLSLAYAMLARHCTVALASMGLDP
jgi:CRISP-associated protein Cas1